jgi:hypothetical protein
VMTRDLCTGLSLLVTGVTDRGEIDARLGEGGLVSKWGSLSIR